MNIAVIFAGGIGARMNSKSKPKQFLLIHEKPIIVHTLDLFENHSEIDAIVIACIKEWIPYLENLIKKYHLTKVKKIVPGGKTGQESIYNGLLAAKCISNKSELDDIVLIHDGVRPLIKTETITDNIDAVKKFGSAITYVKSKETVIVLNEDKELIAIPSRENLCLARAPQSFILKDILDAHYKAINEGRFDFIDSCTMMENYGYNLHLVEGPEENIKITTPEDFYIMRALLDAKENAQIYGYEE